MKKMILVAAICFSGTASAYMCEVDMVDNYSHRRITTIRANDYNDGCKEGMKACRLEIRKRGLLGRADCIRRTSPTNPYPNPNPNPPYPDTNPYPTPGSMDARRMLNNGESAILNNRYVTVIGSNYNGLYAVRSTDGWNTVSNNVRRETLSATSGCSMSVCVNDSIINTLTRRYETVAGLSYNEEFVTKSTDGWNTLSSNNSRRNLAVTNGCAPVGYYGQICVGNTVIDQFNRYSTVAGLQLDGRVVLKSTDGWNTLTTGVDAGSLVITR